MSDGTKCGRPVLVVDDEPALRRLFQSMLERGGYTVVTAAGPTEARTFLAAHPDPLGLVLLDWRMPDGDGGTFCAGLRADPNHSATPVIVLSGNHVPDDAESRFGLRRVLRKPISRPELLREVEAAYADPGRAPAGP